MGTEINFRQLIDLAIGSPEPGHVNFYALHFLLFSFAEKFNLIDEPVDSTNYKYAEALSSEKFGNDLLDQQCQGALCSRNNKYPNFEHKSVKYSGYKFSREVGGADPEEPTVDEELEIEDEMTEFHSQIEEIPPESEEQAAVIVEPKPIADESPTKTLQPEFEPVTELEKVEEVLTQIIETKTAAEEIEVTTQPAQRRMSYDLYRGISIMKDQLELSMAMLRQLVLIAIDKKVTTSHLNKLRSLLDKMVAIQQENIFIQNAYGFHISSDTDDVTEEEVGVEESEAESNPSYKLPLTSHIMEKEISHIQPPAEEYDLDAHICYTPQKLLDQLLDLKSEFCLLTNKVNDISATILAQDCQRTTVFIAELQDQVKDLKFYVSNLKETTDRIESKNLSYNNSLEDLNKALEEIMNEKIDKSEIEILLADKVNYNQLQRKVAQEQMQELQCRFEKQFCDVHNQIKTNDQNMYKAMDNIRTSLGLASVDDILNRFKDKIEAEIRGLRETLRKYMDATNDECAAAGARIKVLQDLACISCDTTCVMRTMEKSKVPKLRNAHASNLLSPLITYEISSIRKSGIMGYYRKDDYPHAPNAWLNQQRAALKMCVPRHAGGAHTTHTAKEHFQKVIVAKK